MVDKIGLTEKQLAIFDFIKAHQVTTGVTPTQTEMAQHFETAQSNIAKHLAAIERRGWIVRPRGLKNGITILP